MTGSNKILTVSYGTFSCTLEGFDDPFGTMRGIAEYFRDLAADDRYFGAEPPTPDAEMLQNIAQKEVRQRVEARVGDNGVALRQVAKDEPKSEQASVEDAETLESGPLAFDDEYLLADEPEDVLTVDVSAEPIEEDAPVESVAEKLRRIRAVVSRNIEPQTAEAGEQPNQTDAPSDESAPRKRSRALTQTINSITADLADDDEDEYADEQFSSGILDDVDEADEQAQFEQADETDRVISNIVSEDSSADEAEEEVESPIEPETNVEEEDTFEEELSAAIADASEDQPEETDDLVSEDQASDGAAEEEDADDDDVAAMVASVASKSADADSEGDDDASDEKDKSSSLEPITDDEKDVGRLLEETDNQFNDGEGIRRRRVISQMRAAVAATKADRVFSRLVTRTVTSEEQKTPYRDDLKRVITRTPTQEETQQIAADNAKVQSAAPLVLVSSQRVDEDDQFGDEPAKADISAEDMPENFKEFANQMGATELTDLLEAAAAYSAFVEGQPHFSRPEIMKRVARVDPALEMSREAGLRSFGQLLRQGKIRKLQRGQFAISEDTRFNPTQRIAGE